MLVKRVSWKVLLKFFNTDNGDIFAIRRQNNCEKKKNRIDSFTTPCNEKAFRKYRLSKAELKLTQFCKRKMLKVKILGQKYAVESERLWLI